MSDQVDSSPELAKIAKLNGDFQRNYGTLLGAFLYLRSIRAAAGRSWWSGVIVTLVTAAATLWAKRGGLWPS